MISVFIVCTVASASVYYVRVRKYPKRFCSLDRLKATCWFMIGLSCLAQQVTALYVSVGLLALATSSRTVLLASQLYVRAKRDAKDCNYNRGVCGSAVSDILPTKDH